MIFRYLFLNFTNINLYTISKLYVLNLKLISYLYIFSRSELRILNLKVCERKILLPLFFGKSAFLAYS